MAFRFLHTADLHLGSPLKGLSAREPALADLFERASWRAFETLVAVAIAEAVDFVVVAGDVFDRDWKDYAVGQAFTREIAKLARAGIRVVMIRGNHDAESQISRDLPLPDGVRWLGSGRAETLDWPDLGVAIHGMSFPDPKVPDPMVQHYPAATTARFNIGLMHTSLAGTASEDRYAPCSLADLAGRGYDYWGLGHIHTRAIVQERGPVVVFPGNIQGRSIRETGRKTVTLVTVDGSQITALREHPVDSARWALVEVDASGCLERPDLFDRARPAIDRAFSTADDRPTAIRLRLTGESPLAERLAADPRRLREELQAVATGISDKIAVESLRIDTTPPRHRAAPLAIEDFADALAAAAADPALIAALGDDLSALANRSAALAGQVEPDPARVLDRAKALLMARLEDLG